MLEPCSAHSSRLNGNLGSALLEGPPIISNFAMNRQTPHSADVLGSLPAERANALFSKARAVVLNAGQNLFTEGDEATDVIASKRAYSKRLSAHQMAANAS